MLNIYKRCDDVMKRITKYDVRLVKESSSLYDYDQKVLNNPYAVSCMLNEIFDMECLCEEHFVMLALNTKLRVVGAFDIHTGTLNSSVVSIRSIFSRAILCNANSIIVAHNHPSGIVKPSHEDISITRRIKEASEILDIKLQDHIIIGEDDYYSFRNEGRL